MSSKTIILEFVFVTIFQLNSEEYKVPLNQLYFRRMVYWKLVLQQFSSRNYFLSHVLSKLASDVVNLYGLTYGLFVSKFGHGMKCIFSKVAFPKSYNRIWEGSLVILNDHIVKFYGRTKLSLSRSQQKFPGFGIKYVFFRFTKEYINMNFSLFESAGVRDIRLWVSYVSHFCFLSIQTESLILPNQYLMVWLCIHFLYRYGVIHICMNYGSTARCQIYSDPSAGWLLWLSSDCC
jgi:hypothetical protein